jgi:hypothetical protein
MTTRAQRSFWNDVRKRFENLEVIIVMGIQLLILKPNKEQLFAQDILEFAIAKYKATAMSGWNVLVEHVDPARWIDLFFVSRHAGQHPHSWTECDAWSTAWDEPVAAGWVHATTRARRQQLATKTELTQFDSALAARAIDYDLLIFLNDEYATHLGNRLGITDYLLYLIVHECLHYCEDWTGKHLVEDCVPPSQDREVVATLSEFVQSIGGWDVLKRRYT